MREKQIGYMNERYPIYHCRGVMRKHNSKECEENNMPNKNIEQETREKSVYKNTS